MSNSNSGKKPWTARRIHLWIGVILAVPMTLMAITGILIAMRSVTHIQIPMRWLGAESIPERLPINAFVQGPDGAAWIGNAQGLYRIAEGKAEPVPHFDGQEVVGLAFPAGAALPIVATRMAVWAEGDGRWTPTKRGRVRQLTTLPDGRVLTVAGGRGEMADGRPFVSADGVEWTPFAPALRANMALPLLDDPKVALHQAMRELHSGAYFFGKGPGEMVWSNLLGWVLAGLSLTGLWIWLKAERVKARKRSAAAAPASSPSPVSASVSAAAEG
jgi:hypothetical protein